LVNGSDASLSQAWLVSPGVALGMNWRRRPVVVALLPRCQMQVFGRQSPVADLKNRSDLQSGTVGRLQGVDDGGLFG
jgi:hypothetical protein